MLCFRLVARFKSRRDGYRIDRVHVERLYAQLRAGGALVTDVSSARILRAVADSGVFYLGGVLVGTRMAELLND